MSAIVIRPVRHSGDVPAMVAFLERLGLAQVPGPHPAGEVEMVGGSGMVGLRPATDEAPAGTTLLSAVVADLGGFVAGLEQAGVAVRVQEGTAHVTDPRGTELRVDGDPACGDVRPHGDLHVLPMVYVEDHTDDKGFFEAWGLQALGVERPGHVNMGRPGVGGAIAIHKPVPGRAELPELPGVTQLAMGTETALEELSARLAEGGWETTMHHTPRGDRLGVVDPDGQLLKIHPR